MGILNIGHTHHNGSICHTSNTGNTNHTSNIIISILKFTMICIRFCLFVSVDDVMKLSI